MSGYFVAMPTVIGGDFDHLSNFKFSDLLPLHLSLSTGRNTLLLSFLMIHCFFRLVSHDVSILPPNVG